MRTTRLLLWGSVAWGAFAACGPNGSCPSLALDASTLPSVPTIPVGFDAFRQWDHWPYLRIGMRAHMDSTFDRTGGNEGGDAAHYVRLTDDRAVALDVKGPGVLYFARANNWHGSPWHYKVDGHDHVVSETNTPPASFSATSTFVPPEPYPEPFAYTSGTTAGADLLGVPVPFTDSLELGYGHTHYGTGYFIYDVFPSTATNLSQPIASWDEQAPPQDVIDLVNQAGQDIAPTTPDMTTIGGTVALSASGTATVFDAVGPSVIRALQLTVPIADAEALAAATLRITWDGRATPSVEAPLGLFFGAGSLYNRDHREWLVKALPVSVHFQGPTVTFAVYFPMPFFRTAHVELASVGAAASAVTWQARTQAYTDPTNWVGYFHASYVDQGTPTPGADLVLLDTTKVEGGGDWCGNIVGTSFVFSDYAILPAYPSPAHGTTLEGDPRFFFDDSQTPQVQGTGTEEWGGGGDYWLRFPAVSTNTTLPFFGHPVGAALDCRPPATRPDCARNAEDAIQSAYRFLLADLMPFGKNARLQLEHGGYDESTEHYRTVAYWYGLPGACLTQTDALHVGDASDEQTHHYVSPDASGVDVLTSRYNWGVDHVGGDPQRAEAYPATTDSGRHTTGTTELTLAINPKNYGVLLRRKLDYSYPDQRAEVFIAQDERSCFADAGTWYTAGSSTCVYSNPPLESDVFAAPPVPQTSNRQWRDDEFLIPRALTEGRSTIRVRLVFSPTNMPLTPQTPVATEAWSEYRYAAYVWTLPPAP